MRGVIPVFAICGMVLSANAKSLLISPIAADSASADVKTISRLYHDALAAQYKGQVLPTLPSPCSDRDCALNAARQAGADEIIYSNFHRLGSEWIFSSTLLDTATGTVFNQRLMAVNIEDMQPVTRRMADALLARKTIDQVASLENVTGIETEKAPARRRSFFSSGMSLGYLWPVGNSYSYRVEDPHNYGAYLLKTSSRWPHFTWMNLWELNNDLLVDAELAVEPTGSVPITGGDLTLNHMFNRTDFAPFLGAGLGLHYSTPDADKPADKRNSGPTVLTQGGVMLFHTYDLHVLLRGQYRLTLNSDVDNGFITDVAITYKMKKIEEKKDDHLTTKIIALSALGLLLFGLTWSASH